MATNGADAADDDRLDAEIDETTEDSSRPGISWRRTRWSCETSPGRPAGWSGFLTVHCACQIPYLGGFTFYDDALEDERRAALEAVADAHLAQRHAQLGLFDGCRCR